MISHSVLRRPLTYRLVAVSGVSLTITSYNFDSNFYCVKIVFKKTSDSLLEQKYDKSCILYQDLLVRTHLTESATVRSAPSILRRGRSGVLFPRKLFEIVQCIKRVLENIRKQAS